MNGILKKVKDRDREYGYQGLTVEGEVGYKGPQKDLGWGGDAPFLHKVMIS